MNKDELKAKLIGILGKKFAKTKDYVALHEKFDKVLSSLDAKFSQQIIKQVNLPSEIVFNGLKDELSGVLKENNKGAMDVLNSLSAEIIKAYNSKPAWFKEFDGKVEVQNEIKVAGVVKVEQDPSAMIAIVQAALQGIFDFFAKLAKNTFKVRLPSDHYVTPQMVVLIDPQTMKAVDMKDIGAGTFKQTINQFGGARGPASVGLKGYGSIGDGQTTVTTAGTRVQMPDVACSRVRIQAHPSNTGEVTVGGANVVADSATRRGLTLFSSQWEEFYVNNLNLLYIDSTQNGDKINYIYEV